MLKEVFLLIVLINLTYTEESCGISHYSNITKQEHFPWIATLFSNVNKTSSGSDKFLCGSSIISNKYSVTASHCIQEKGSTYRRKCNEIFLLTGVYDLKHIENANKIIIEQIIVHPDYSAETETYDADLALIKFKNSLIFDANTMPLCLWWNEHVTETVNGKIISFTDPEEGEPGYINYEHDANHNYPRRFTMPIRSDCTKQPRFKRIASERTFCGGGFNSGPCLEIGNSGSSMAVEINEKYYIRGIVSASFIDFAGCDNYTFSLFTDVPKFKEWIVNEITLN